MSGESWADEHHRLSEQLHSLQTGAAQHFDDGQTGPLGTDSTADQIERMQQRIAELTDRLDPKHNG